MNEDENIKQEEVAEIDEEKEQLLLESEISQRLVLEHPSYKKLLDKLTEEEQKAQEYKNNWLRAQADIENLKRRTEKDIAYAHKYGIEKFAHEILSTIDNLERALSIKLSDDKELKDFYAGIELTLKSLLEILQKFEITQMDPLGEDFDHEKHTAMTTREDNDAKPNTILEVIQKGYWFKDRLLRSALVIVAKNI